MMLDKADFLIIGSMLIVLAFMVILVSVIAVLPLVLEETFDAAEREFYNITVNCSSTPESGTMEIDLDGIKQYCKLRRVEKDGNRLAYYR